MRVMKVLPKRFGKYKLNLHPGKTKVIDLLTTSGQGDRSFDFLGFTHYIGKSRKGYLILKRKTSRKKFNKAVNQTDEWLKRNRHKKLKELITELNVKLTGHYAYYGITFNTRGISRFYVAVICRLHVWLNRRGGKPVWNWEKFSLLIYKWLPLNRPKIYHSFV